MSPPPRGFCSPPPPPSPLLYFLDRCLLLTFPFIHHPTINTHPDQRFHAVFSPSTSLGSFQRPTVASYFQTRTFITFHDQITTASNDQFQERAHRSHTLKPTGARASEELGVERETIPIENGRKNQEPVDIQPSSHKPAARNVAKPSPLPTSSHRPPKTTRLLHHDAWCKRRGASSASGLDSVLAEGFAGS